MGKSITTEGGLKGAFVRDYSQSWILCNGFESHPKIMEPLVHWEFDHRQAVQEQQEGAAKVLLLGGYN